MDEQNVATPVLRPLVWMGDSKRNGRNPLPAPVSLLFDNDL